jgi:hypothetical protein
MFPTSALSKLNGKQTQLYWDDSYVKLLDENGKLVSGKVEWYHDNVLTSTCYYKDGVFHNDSGPAMIRTVNGAKEWYVNGQNIPTNRLTQKDLENIRQHYPKLYPSIVEYLAEKYL